MAATDNPDVNDVDTFTAEFRNDVAALVDPTTVVFRVLTPAGTTVTVANVRRSLGIFDATYEYLASGDHVVSAKGTGVVKAYAELLVTVNEKRVADA